MVRVNSKQESFRRKEDRKIGREEEKAMDTVRMGIVGFGNMGHRTCRKYRCRKDRPYGACGNR